jgi:hypothetical protein
MVMRAAKASRAGPVKTADKPKDGRPISPATPDRQPVSVDEIRLRAYLRWEAAGRPPGDGVRFWLYAERELRQAK